ncbi:hypothetical protein UPYG_G00351500 [Umbra pygmaea]|uniref:Myosin tail domain-containing protein n=1 Tax=Umbra pygmaea TaxID=75934 RepID=A0ABD0VZF2_UMBPY
MQGKSEHEQQTNNMETSVGDSSGAVFSPSISAATEQGRDSATPPTQAPSHPGLRKNPSSSLEEENIGRTNQMAVCRGTKLVRSGSVKGLIHKFSGSENKEASTANDSGSPILPLGGSLPENSNRPIRMSSARTGTNTATTSQLQLDPTTQSPLPLQTQSPVPSIRVIPAYSESNPSSGKSLSNSSSMADSGMGSELDFDANKHPESPASEDERSPSVRARQNPKYQLFLSGDMIGNGSRDTDGSVAGGQNGFAREFRNSTDSRFSPNHRGSLESLASRDWDTMSDRVGGFDSPPRVFNSPYTSAMSMEYNPGMNRMSEYKVPEGLSRTSSELNIFNSFNTRSTSPTLTPTGTLTRARFSTFDTIRRRDPPQVMPNNISMRPQVSTFTMPNKRDYIQELTKQMDECQKRNQFLEAESVVMEKERNQIRFEMRGLLVQREDLLRANTTQQGEIKRMNERMMELERKNASMVEQFQAMEREMKEAREVMVEANTQEYAFNFLQQTLKNKIQDAEEALEKQSLHAQGVSEKLWLSERQLETLMADKEVLEKRNSDLSITVTRLESELSESLQTATRATAELSLHQKLRDDAQLRVDELEEIHLEKCQELQKVQEIVNRLQGEVSGKLIDKERTLEEEIQLKEKFQLQWKQAERTVDDLRMELHTVAQTKEDIAKQLKQAQEKMIDLESDLEEFQDSEQRWASKHKRAIEQMDQLQLKLLQEKDLNDQLECEKVILERQLRELRMEVELLQSNKDQVDAISKTESRAKELENALRVEERNKVVMTNTINKLERKIKELTDQLDEEHKISTEQKDLLNQRMRSLKHQLNEAEEESRRRETQYRHSQRELSEERENVNRLQRQILDQSLQLKRTESTKTLRQTLGDLRLDEDEIHMPCKF